MCRRTPLSPLLLILATGLAVPLPAQFGAVEVAQQELATLANQMGLVAIDTTYLTTLENLDDLSSPTNTNLFDYINEDGGALVISPATGRFRNPPRLDLLNRPPGLNWQGPYVSYQPSRIDGPASTYDEGTPLDPWGTPYYFYTPLGLVDPQAEAIRLEGYLDDFNQYTLVSLGPDGVLSGDDLIRSIPGFTIAVPVISSVRVTAPVSKTGQWTVQVRGYKFGTLQGEGTVAVDGTTVAATLWTDTRVEFPLGTAPGTIAVFTVTPDGRAPIEFQGFLQEGTVGVADWTLY